MAPTRERTPWLFLAAFCLVFYSTGAACVESFVNYPSWRWIGQGEFLAYHQGIDPLVIRFLALPMLAGFLVTISLLRFRPAQVPGWSVGAALALQLVVLVATVAIHLPIQRQFNTAGFSAPLLDELIATNFWLRRVPYFANAALFVWMMGRALRKAN